MVDPSLFELPRLLEYLLTRGEQRGYLGNTWRLRAEILPAYRPPFMPEAEPTRCVVRFGNSFLRHSKGPLQGHAWDVYGDDYIRPELALLALLEAPPPPDVLRWSADAESKEATACPATR